MRMYRKPVLKVKVGGQPYARGALCYTYLISQPGAFKKLGTSENPQKLAKSLSMLPFPGLILLEARAFHTRGQAMEHESTLRTKFARHRIAPPAFANPRSTKYFSPEAEIFL
jgi:hypothetical protein